MKIVFALATHNPDDERVWYHQKKTLEEMGNEVYIISSCLKNYKLKNVVTFDSNKTKKQKIETFVNELKLIEPNIIICDTPLTIFAAKKYKKKSNLKIYYDVTEWYPSKKNLRSCNFIITKIFKSILLSFVSFITPFFISGFIFGEYYKSLPFRILFPFKKHIYLPYYADIEYINALPTKDISKECTLSYTGPATEEKGFYTFFEVARKCAEKNPNTKFILRLICEPEIDLKIDNLHNIEIQYSKYLAFTDFCKEISKADIYFDLRKIDFENRRCLPIKLFYYMACGRPVIYPNLKAIRKDVPEIDEFGFLVNSNNTVDTVEKISQYIKNEKLYKQHSNRARELAEIKYNWKNIENQFIEFIEK